jgi:protein gp37
MGDKTAISWCDHTFNAWWGCTHAQRSLLDDGQTAPECENCYAETFDHRLGGSHWGPTAPRRTFGDAYWEKPRRWNAEAAKAGKRASVFCSSMADVFEHHAVPEVEAVLNEQRARLWRLINDTRHLDWLMLSKRPENFARYVPWMAWMKSDDPDSGRPWENVWLGVTCGARSSLWRVDILRETPAAKRFVSCEPLLDHITAEEWDRALTVRNVMMERDLCASETATQIDLVTIGPPGIDWLIVGDESGRNRRSAQLDWVRTAREAALRHRVAFHFKQWNAGDKKVHLPVLDGRQHAATPGGES